MPSQLSARAFVDRWRGVELKERSAAQEHSSELCRLVGHPTPVQSDPTDLSYASEAGATKHRGEGWAFVRT